MSKQFSFYLTARDSLNLKSYLHQTFQVVFLADESKQPKAKVFTKLSVSGIEKESVVLFTRSENLDDLDFYEVETRKLWVVDTLVSPVIEFSNCYFDRDTLGPGRLYCTTGYYDNKDEWVTKNPDFLAWVQKVFSATKKMLSRNKALDVYFGEEAKQLYDDRKIELCNL